MAAAFNCQLSIGAGYPIVIPASIVIPAPTVIPAKAGIHTPTY